MNKYKLVIFDWDGTLMDSVPKIVACIQQSAADFGIDVPSNERAKDIIGISLEPAMQRLFPSLDNVQIAQMIRIYKHNYVYSNTTDTPMFDGAFDCLRALQEQGSTLAVATGKARKGLQRAWVMSGSGAFFSASCCADEAKSKPDPEMLCAILKTLNMSCEDAIMVGDTCYDLQMAKAIGMRRIGITHGVHKRSVLAKEEPIAIVDDLFQLRSYLLPQS